MECGVCKFWKAGRLGVVGECEIDMEGKTQNDSCNRGELKQEVGEGTNPFYDRNPDGTLKQ